MTNLLSYSDKEIFALKAHVLHARSQTYGWCSTEQVVQLVDAVLAAEPRVCVEIGVYAGASLFPIAFTLNFLGEGEVYAVDSWNVADSLQCFDPVQDEDVWRDSLKACLHQAYADFCRLVKDLGLQNRCIVLPMSAQQAATRIEKQIDFLHLDGNHSAQCFREDVGSYLPKVRPGGYVWVTCRNWVTPERAIECLQENCDVMKKMDSINCVLFKKK